MFPLVDLTRQNVPLFDEIQETIKDVINRSAFILGPEVKTFEANFAAYHDVRHAVGCASGTDALYLALVALGVGPGDEVITTPFTFSATVASILRVGATAVMVDIDPVTYTMDPEKTVAAVTDKTKAIIPVHIYGQAVDMDVMADLAKKHDIKIIEDCAQAHGAKWKGQKVGTFGDINCFSFFPSKNLSAFGDAGICITNNEKYADRMSRLRVHGSVQKMESLELGANSRLDNLQAAILDIKLKHLDRWNSERQQAAKWYDAGLEGDDRFVLPAIGENRDHVYHLYVIQTDDRENLMKHIQEQGFSCGQHYPIPLHVMPAFKHYGPAKGDLPIAEALCERVVTLPMFPGIKEGEVQAVAEAVKSF